jgi:hypothetical protein
MEVNDEEGLREAQEGWVEHMEQVWEMLKEKPINGSIGQ